MNPNIQARIQKAKAMGFNDQQIAQRLQARPPQPMQQTPQSQGGGLLDLLPLLGGVGGGLLGAPLGPIGSIGGSGVGSALGEYLRQKASGGQTDVGNIAKEGALGLAGGTLGEALGFGLKLGGKALGAVGKGVSKGGSELLAAQYNVPRTAARALKMPETIARLADEFGITNINEIPKVAEKVTGGNGILTKLTREAAGQAERVNTTGVLQLAKNFTDNPAIEDATAKKVLNFVQKGLMKTSGGMKGSILEGADPSEMFGFIQQLEKEASKINRIPQFQRTGQDLAIKEVYQNLAEELKDRLFVKAGGDRALVGNLLNPETLAQIAEINPQLAQKVANVKSVGELRGLAEPFVKGSQLAFETEAGSQLGFAGVGGAAKGLGKLAQNPLNILAAPLGSDAVNAGLGGAMKKAGASMAGATLPTPARGVLPSIAGKTLSQTAPRAAADILTSGGGYSPAEEGEIMDGDNVDVARAPSPIALTREDALALMLAFPKQASLIKTLYDFGAGEAGGKVSAQQTKDRAVADSGLRQLSTIEQMLADDPSVVFKAAVPGSPGARKYLSAVREAADAILRLRTGAQANKSEIEMYMQQFFPQPLDSPETIRYKIQTRRKYLQDIAKGQGTSEDLPLPDDINFNQ